MIAGALIAGAPPPGTPGTPHLPSIEARARLEDAAAAKLQGLWRTRSARAAIKALCASVVTKMFDAESGCDVPRPVQGLECRATV